MRANRSDLPVGELVEGLRDGGWADLDNARTDVTMGDHRVELVGVDDPHVGYDRYAAVSGPAADDVALTMGLVHAPYQRVLDAMVADGASVVLAGPHPRRAARPARLGRPGHQLRPRHPPRQGRLPLVAGCRPHRPRRGGAAPSSQAPAMPPGCTSRPGSGTSPYAPVRFACRPEATLLTLLARDA